MGIFGAIVVHQRFTFARKLKRTNYYCDSIVFVFFSYLHSSVYEPIKCRVECVLDDV